MHDTILDVAPNAAFPPVVPIPAVLIPVHDMQPALAAPPVVK